MNFAAMLATSVTPLSEYKPPSREERTKKPKVVKPKPAPKMRAMNHANIALRESTIAAYRAAWRDEEWLPTPTLEARLGLKPSCCRPTLCRWERLGLVESRRILGRNGGWDRRSGVEWRWVE